MRVIGTIFSILLLILLVAMLWIYWFTGFSEINLSQEAPYHSNFTINNSELSEGRILFYENLRYSDEKISYRIGELCTLQKRADAETAFEILENKTILDFYSVKNSEELFIGCEDRQITKEDFFIAGEGGPVNITRSGDFNVITFGEVVLIRSSECQNPNIALHEILHSMGFDHSANSNNIMYSISKCEQTLGEDIPKLINELYSIPDYPDLVISEVLPEIHGRYLDVNASIKNNGLKTSREAVLNIYVDDSPVYSLDVQPFNIGSGIKFSLKNVPLKKSNFEKLIFIVEYSDPEISKSNNEVVFSVKSES